MNIVFGAENEPKYLTLKKTYRTTEEIMNVANHVITNVIEKINCSLGEPVMKSGEPVTIKGFETENDMLEQIKNRITELKGRGLKNIALICKTVPDCQKLAEQLSDYENIHIITDKDAEYNGGVSIVPSYLSKGLEFDAVIITDADIQNYSLSEVDTKLLYVCITRAMNTLDIYHVNELTKLLDTL